MANGREKVVAELKAASVATRNIVMAKQRHLRNAPLLEAVLDIRVVPRPDQRYEHLAALEPMFGPKYKKVGEKRNTDFRLELRPDGQPKSSFTSGSELIGMMLADETKQNRVQISLDEFTQNVLGPYPDFETLVAEARPNWEVFKEGYRPLAISRIALRYVNDLRIPAGAVAIEDYLPVTPSIPKAVPQTVLDFVYRMTINNAAIGAKAIVNQIFQGVTDERGAQVLLDIDAIIERQIDIDDPTLWEKFAALRKFKNDIFFEFASERLLETYE